MPSCLKSISILIALSFISIVAFSSEEDIAPWRSVAIDCGDLGQAKHVVFSATADQHAISSFKITAFARTYEIKGDDLKKMRGFSLQGIQVTHEAGYPSTGGYTVYFKLKKTPHETAIVSVQEKGNAKTVIR